MENCLPVRANANDRMISMGLEDKNSYSDQNLINNICENKPGPEWHVPRSGFLVVGSVFAPSQPFSP